MAYAQFSDLAARPYTSRRLGYKRQCAESWQVSMNDQIIRDDHAYEVLIYQRELEKIEKVIETNNMLLNSNGKNNSANADSSQQPLLVNTSSFNNENFQNCLSLSRDIERQEQLRQIRRRLSHPTPLEATLTYEEIFECSFVDDRDQDYQNSTGPRQVTDLDVSQSIEDCMRYFDEDVNVDSGPSRCDTPNKMPSAGTVAAAVANFQTQMSKVMGSPPPPYQEHATPKVREERAQPTPQTSTIQQLRKKYEQNIVKEPSKAQEKPPKGKELRRSAPIVPTPTLPKRPKSPKLSRKSKVKQMAHMFNNKIHQLMRRDSTNQQGYTQLNVTQTPAPKPAKKVGLLKPASKVRRTPSFRTGLPSPVPSPRFKRKPAHNTTGQPLSDSESACLVAEDVFRKLSVKDKALLYNKFIEDMSKQHPQFSVHARLVEATVRQELERSEREQKSPKVKELARELEAKFNLPKPKISTWALKRLAELQKTPEYDAVNRRISLTPPPPAIAAALQSFQEQEEEKELNEAKQTECEPEYAEIEEAEELHVSTLTVVLKPSPGKLTPKQREVPRLLPRKARELQFIHDMRQIERSQKRNCESMRASVSFEAYGPPKKIRRTRAERLQPKAIFQNTHMERLFYNWIMEKNGVTFDITTVENSEDSLCANGDDANTSKGSTKSKSKVHVLLQKAIAKLENVEARVMKRDSFVSKKTEKALKIIKETTEKKVDKSVIEVDLSNSKTGTSSDEIHAEATKRLQRKVKRPAPQPPKTQNSNFEKGNEQDFSSLTSSDKQSEAESESGLSSLPKITSDESQPEQTAPTTYVNKTADSELVKPIKPLRKKKLRRTLTWKKENCIIESRPIPSSTDSEGEHAKTGEKVEEEVVYVNVMQPVERTEEKLDKTELKEMAAAAEEALNIEQQQEKEITNDDTMMNNLNTPQKIRSAYTLTAMSTPSAYTESDPSPVTESDPEIIRKSSMRQLALSSPTLAAQEEKKLRDTPKKTVDTKSARNNSSTLDITQAEDTLQKLIDSFVDLGFETGSNGMESPVRRPAPVPAPRRSKGASPLFIKLTPELEKTLQQNRSSFSSTPVKGMTSNQSYQAFNNNAARQLQQQSISPIGTLNAGRRRSLNPIDDSRRNSIAMEVISEDRPLEHVNRSQTQTPQSPNVMETSFFGNSFNLNVSQNNEQVERPSKFWIRADDFTISMDVFYNPPDRLRLLYDIFSQKSSETRDLHFGIDDYKFSAQKLGDKADISNRLPTINGCSHYWFSTGDLAVPFNGKYMAPEKIERMFTFIKDTIAEKAQLRFGVDDYEFSSVPENWETCAKFSMESSYSMLVGLQGTNNGLEGRGRFAWPSSVYNSANSNGSSIKTSDLDCSEMCSDFDNSELRYLTESPTGTNYFDVASVDSADMILPNDSIGKKCEHFFDMNIDFDSLDKLFEEDQKLNNTLDSNFKQSIPEMLQKLQQQKVKLTALEKRMKTYSNHSGIAGAVIPHSKESPLYMQKLRIIINAIDNIGRENGFKACSMKQLESFMYFLTRYADLCLASCDKHMNKVLDALLDQQQKQQQELIEPPENELQKSHDHNPAALSEHQLRVQASLQRLNIPDWFRQYNQNTSRSPEGNTTGYKPGNFTRKRTTESGRWAGLNSKTTSLSSLGSQRSDRSPLLLSPSAHSHHGGQGAQQHGTASTSAYGTASAGGGAGAFSRWSTSHLNSSQTSPSVSQRGSFTRGGPINSSFISVASGQSSVIRSSYRQPYLGWRSQEKLSQRTPHERLASSLLAQQQRTSPTQRSAGVTANGDNGSKLQPVTPEIQSSIKEVTSAIVHYVNDQTQQQQQQQQRSRSASPNSRKCWLESSFVGIRPLDSPQTPVIENTTTAFSSATNTNNNNTATNNSISSQYNNYNYNYNYNTSNSSSNTLTAITTPNSVGGIGITTAITTNPHVLRMNGLSIVGGAPERSLSTASLEDVLASLLGLPSSSASSSGGVQGVNVGAGAGAGAGLGASVGVGVNVNAGPSATSDPYARSTTTGDSASQSLVTFRHMPQQQQQQTQNPQSQTQLQQSQQQQLLLVQLQAEQQRLRRRSEGDAPQQQKQQQLQQQQQNAKTNTSTSNSIGATTHSNVSHLQDASTNNHSSAGIGGGSVSAGNAALSTPRVSLGDSSESNNKTTSELQIKCRNTKCDRSATPADAKKYYKSCHNCTYLYCSRECRRAHWEKHRKACLHSRASNLCRQVLATCKDDVDSQRHLSLLARKGFLSQGRGVVRVLFRSAEAAESFIKHGFQCMGEASYVRWPDLMPAEMGLELYSELLKLSTEYKPDSKMLIYVAICVVSEAPGMGQAPVRWERQLVSRCAKLKLCKSILAELEQQQLALQLQQQTQPPLTVVAVPEPTTEILILTFNPTLRSNNGQGELILSNILDILSRRGVLLRKHYPEIYQRLQTFTDGQTDKFNPVTLHPRDSQTGKSFVCIIMPVHSSDSDVIKLPSASDGGNRVTTIDVGSPAALAQLDDDELLTRSTS